VTQEWWQDRREQFDLFVSQLVEQEIISGDKDAVSKRQQALTKCSFLNITLDAIQLTERLIDQNAIPKQASEDALHIAVASVSSMDYLLTWNFKHIANAAMRAYVELVCRLNGYEPPVICSPKDIQRSARRKLIYLDDTEDLQDLLAPPGNRLEKLKGDRAGQYSIRINDQWRICFKWSGNEAEDVEMVDYHG
jgi:plasmid maintenance system killer protein